MADSDYESAEDEPVYIGMDAHNLFFKGTPDDIIAYAHANMDSVHVCEIHSELLERACNIAELEPVVDYLLHGEESQANPRYRTSRCAWEAIIGGSLGAIKLLAEDGRADIQASIDRRIDGENHEMELQYDDPARVAKTRPIFTHLYECGALTFDSERMRTFMATIKGGNNFVAEAMVEGALESGRWAPTAADFLPPEGDVDAEDTWGCSYHDLGIIGKSALMGNAGLVEMLAKDPWADGKELARGWRLSGKSSLVDGSPPWESLRAKILDVILATFDGTGVFDKHDENRAGDHRLLMLATKPDGTYAQDLRLVSAYDRKYVEKFLATNYRAAQNPLSFRSLVRNREWGKIMRLFETLGFRSEWPKDAATMRLTLPYADADKSGVSDNSDLVGISPKIREAAIVGAGVTGDAELLRPLLNTDDDISETAGLTLKHATLNQHTQAVAVLVRSGKIRREHMAGVYTAALRQPRADIAMAVLDREAALRLFEKEADLIVDAVVKQFGGSLLAAWTLAKAASSCDT